MRELNVTEPFLLCTKYSVLEKKIASVIVTIFHFFMFVDQLLLVDAFSQLYYPLYYLTHSLRSSRLEVVRELSQRRRRRHRGRQKSNRFILAKKHFARASRFFVHFFTVLARLQRENA